MDFAANLRPDAFAGTAAAYLRYRPPYPRVLLDDLLDRVPGRAVLADLASGPGRIALDLAPSFDKVLAVDLEPEMVAVGREAAARRGIGNIVWRVGRAEEAQMPNRSVDLITIGEAFHRLDQAAITARALDWLKPGGCLATPGAEGLLAGGEGWKGRAAQVARRWIDRRFPDGVAQGRDGAELGPEGAERALRRAGFVGVESRAFVEPREWSFEAIVGYLRSTSVCSDKALGDDSAIFEAELRAALGGAPQGVFREDFRCGYTVGRRPN